MKRAFYSVLSLLLLTGVMFLVAGSVDLSSYLENLPNTVLHIAALILIGGMWFVTLKWSRDFERTWRLTAEEVSRRAHTKMKGGKTRINIIYTTPEKIVIGFVGCLIFTSFLAFQAFMSVGSPGTELEFAL